MLRPSILDSTLMYVIFGIVRLHAHLPSVPPRHGYIILEAVYGVASPIQYYYALDGIRGSSC